MPALEGNPEDDAVPTEEQVEGSESSNEDAAREILRLARLRFERGEYAQAVESFSSILKTPVRLFSRRDLHEGFLYYAFTLFLQGATEHATEALEIALRLDPEFAPSPVTTRPDLLAFYEGQHSSFAASQGGVAEAPEAIFPELAEKPGAAPLLQRQRFVPLLGIGLRQLGHPRLGYGLLGTELSAFGVNIASLIFRASFIEDRTPKGLTNTLIAREMNYASFGIFWGAMLADFIVSMVLRRYYVHHPEKRRTTGTLVNKTPVRCPQLRAGRTSLTLSFW